MDGPVDVLALADWRRRTAELYVTVRQLQAVDPEAAWDLWRTVRDSLYREHPQSPVPAAEREAFRGRHFEYDPTLRFEVPVQTDQTDLAPGGPTGVTDLAPAGTPAEVELPMSAGTPMLFRLAGRANIPFPAGERCLSLYWIEGYAGGLFLPFRDATNGRQTYGAGRYLLDAAKGADLGGDILRGSLVLDFNFAYHPSCAFDPQWACPLAPPENRLDIAIHAGERLA